MISKSFLAASRAAGLTDGEILAAWEDFERAAAIWPTARQVGARFGRSREAARVWCLRGLLEAVKVDGVWRVNPAALETFTPPVDKGGRPRRKDVTK